MSTGLLSGCEVRLTRPGGYRRQISRDGVRNGTWGCAHLVHFGIWAKWTQIWQGPFGSIGSRCVSALSAPRVQSSREDQPR